LRQQAWAQIDANKLAGLTFFFVGSEIIETVRQFKYLGRHISSDDKDEFAIMANITKACNRWSRCSRVLSATGASPKIMAKFYLAVIEAILLYGSETWVITRRSLCRLDTFHHRCARYLAHMHIRRNSEGVWMYPPSAEVLEKCGLSPIMTYIIKRKQ
jgi:hypothetical protein